MRRDIDAKLRGDDQIEQTDRTRPRCGIPAFCDRVKHLDERSRWRACLSCLRKNKRGSKGYVLHRLSSVYIGIAERARGWPGIIDRLLESGVIDYDDLIYLAEARRLWQT